MTPRENLLKLLRRQGYESVPVEFQLCPTLYDAYVAHTGGARPVEEYFDFAHRIVEGPRLTREPVDWMRYYPEGVKDGTEFIEDWGVALEPGSDEAFHMRHFRHPMASFDSVEEILAYPFPDYEHAEWGHVAAQVAEVQAQGRLAIAQMACTIWETSWYLRSMEALMMDMASEDEMATVLLDAVTERACSRAAAFAGAGVDMILLGDDIGMQSRIMMSEDFYREWLKPRLTRVTRAAKAVKPDVLIAYHSCGYVTPLIDDLIEAGVEVLNPVQPECMDFADIHAQFGDRLSFWGAIGTQTTMPFGTPGDIKQTVRRNLEIAGERGGLFCAPTHLLEPEVPWENVLAYVEACREFTGK